MQKAIRPLPRGAFFSLPPPAALSRREKKKVLFLFFVFLFFFVLVLVLVRFAIVCYLLFAFVPDAKTGEATLSPTANVVATDVLGIVPAQKSISYSKNLSASFCASLATVTLPAHFSAFRAPSILTASFTFIPEELLNFSVYF